MLLTKYYYEGENKEEEMGDVERVQMRNPHKNLIGKPEGIRMYRTSARKWNVRLIEIGL